MIEEERKQTEMKSNKKKTENKNSKLFLSLCITV